MFSDFLLTFNSVDPPELPNVEIRLGQMTVIEMSWNEGTLV